MRHLYRSNHSAFASAQQAYDNMLPPEDFELTRAQEATVKEVLDWAAIPDFVDEISNGMFEIAKVRLSPQAQKDLADSINDLVATAVGYAV